VTKNKYNRHQTFELKRTSGRYNPNQVKETVKTLPTDAIPADFYVHPESIFFKVALPTTPLIRPTPYNYRQWRNEILKHLIVEDQFLLESTFKDKESEINIVSDGGVHDYNSNLGMVIAVKSKIMAANKGKIYSVAFHESSYWLELIGLLAATASIRQLIKQHKLTVANNKKLNFYCDNKSVIKLINSRQELRRTVNQHQFPDVDIEIQLLHKLKQLNAMNCITTFEHVKGHQDTEKKTKLTTIEALNVEADELTHVARKLPDIKDCHKFPTNKVNLKINHQYINSHYPKMVNLAYHSTALQEYYARKHGWTSQIIDLLWWPIYFQSLAKLSDPDKLRIQKFVNNRLPTLYRDQKYHKKPTGTGYCRQCHLHNESEDHILRCRTPSRQTIRNKWRKELTTFLSESHTPVAIRYAIGHGFYNWL
jgi:hypothetical protein